MRGAGVDRREGVRHAEADVVVRVDAQPHAEAAGREARDLGDLARQRSAVGVAERDDVGAAAFGRLPRGERVLAIVLAAVEGVLRVVDDETAVLLEMAHGVLDHREVLFGRRLQDFEDVQEPGLPVRS